MKTVRFFITLAILLVIGVLTGQELDFSKRSHYTFREGEYGVIRLNLLNAETYDYSSEIRKPFVLRKTDDAGGIEIIFDIRTMDISELEEGKNYRASFPFIKINIGKRENLTVSAVYKPEMVFLSDDSLRTDFIRLEFTPDKMTNRVSVEALRALRSVRLDDPDGLISVGNKETFDLDQGMNEIEVTLNHMENRRGEAYLNRKVQDGNISELTIFVNASGFTSVVKTMISDEHGDDGDIHGEYQEDEDIYGSIAHYEPEEVSEKGFGVLSLVIIIILIIIIAVLAVLLLKSGSGALYEKYETFFDDIATLVKVDMKGQNIDKSIEEIMMILLEKFEFPQEQDAKPSDTKRVLKKPEGLKKTGNSEKPDSGPKEIEKDGGEKKISRGFDFLDD